MTLCFAIGAVVGLLPGRQVHSQGDVRQSERLFPTDVSPQRSSVFPQGLSKVIRAAKPITGTDGAIALDCSVSRTETLATLILPLGSAEDVAQASQRLVLSGASAAHCFRSGEYILAGPAHQKSQSYEEFFVRSFVRGSQPSNLAPLRAGASVPSCLRSVSGSLDNKRCIPDAYWRIPRRAEELRTDQCFKCRQKIGWLHTE